LKRKLNLKTAPNIGERKGSESVMFSEQSMKQTMKINDMIIKDVILLNKKLFEISLLIAISDSQSVIVKINYKQDKILSFTPISATGKHYRIGLKNIFFEENNIIKSIPIIVLRKVMYLSELNYKLHFYFEYNKTNEKVVFRIKKPLVKLALTNDEKNLFICDGENLFQYYCDENKIKSKFEGHKKPVKNFILGQRKKHLYR
jgi:hypothetical protein